MPAFPELRRTLAAAFLCIALPLAAQTTPSRAILAHQSALAQAQSVSYPLGQLPRTTLLNLAIGLPVRNQDQLDTLLADLSDPTSPRYHHYLTPDEFAAQFGPTQQDYQAVIDFAQSHNLKITATYPNRTVLSVSGTAPDIESAFQVNFALYQHPTRGQFFAADREPTLPTGLQIQDVAGLDNFVVPQPMNLHSAPLAQTSAQTSTQTSSQFNAQTISLTSGSGPNGLFIGTDFRNAYAPGVTLNGAGQSVGLLEFDGFYAGDVTKNFVAAKLPATTVSTVLLDGVTGTPGNNNIEVILDIMMASYMAPGVSKVVVYEGSQPNDILNRMATDDIAQLSSSWSFGGVNTTTENIFKQYAAQGQTLFEAAGDSGGYTGAIPTPADDPNLTIVGGTSLSTNGAGGIWLSEAAWSGSGGGVSTTWPIPVWQAGMNLPAKGGSNTMRNIPDVALTGAVQMYLICNNGQAVQVGGTSAATPLWAGFIALANQQAVAAGSGTLGFLNTTLYNIGNSGSYATAFHDITSGSTGPYKALPGYDLTTGWGSPAGQPLINALTNAAPLPYFSIVASATGPLTLTRPGTVNTTITVTPFNGFTGAVTYTVAGLPLGVTANFSQTSSLTTSTLTFTGSSTTTPGTYTILITGTSTSSKAVTNVSLIIPSPTFTLTATPTALAINTGQFAITTISPTPINSFAGVITYSTSGLPQGVTARFSPNLGSVATPVSLMISVPATARAGIYTVNVIGTCGPLSISTPITLTIVAPTFSLASASPDLTLTAGQTVTTTIFSTAINGFSGTITFSATNLPGGVTATFNPASAPVGTPTTLTLSAAATAKTATPTTTIAIIGTSGYLALDTPIALTVLVPGFTLAASSSTINITSKPATGATILSSTAINGLSGAITYTVTGTPAGVTATFSPVSATVGTPTTLTFAVGTITSSGTYTITVTGTSGVATATTTITLKITAPSFTLAFSPSSITVKHGNSVNTSITITPIPPFSGSVSLSAAGLPTGMTMTIVGSSGSSLALKFSTTTSVPAGIYTITMTGSSPNTTPATAILTVTVTN